MAGEPEVLYAQRIHFTTLSTTTLVNLEDGTVEAPATELDGISECTDSTAVDSVDTNYFGSGGYKRNAATLRGLTLNVSGHRIAGNAAQDLMETHMQNGLVGYLHIIKDADAMAGQRGKRYAVKVMSFDGGGPSSDVNKLTVSLMGQGAPVAI
ncbi:phage tail tube protein [Corallococcus sp. 4LFB]|uniref:phage tail tube protein n=1 Tax=Corallococcus sp. 4LFB TaxID=3383249 RepID=UPI003974A332